MDFATQDREYFVWAGIVPGIFVDDIHKLASLCYLRRTTRLHYKMMRTEWRGLILFCIFYLLRYWMRTCLSRQKGCCGILIILLLWFYAGLIPYDVIRRTNAERATCSENRGLSIHRDPSTWWIQICETAVLLTRLKGEPKVLPSCWSINIRIKWATPFPRLDYHIFELEQDVQEAPISEARKVYFTSSTLETSEYKYLLSRY